MGDNKNNRSPLNNNNNNKNQNQQPPAPNSGRFALIFLILITLFILYLFYSQTKEKNTITYNEFVNYVMTKKIESDSTNPLIIYNNGKIVGKDKTGKVFQTNLPPINDNGDLYRLLNEYKIMYRGEPEQSTLMVMLLYNILPIGILIFIIWFMFRQVQNNGNKAFSFGKSKARKFEPKEKIKFTDVAGIDEAKIELGEVVDFLKAPQKFASIGAKIPKGVLLVGPPGTGKTLLARAVAGEADVDFYHMSGSDFVEMFVGVGASRVRDLFEQGRKSAPCILFIDELDAVGRTRGAGYGGGHDEREQTLNQILVEMDGFDPTLGVILLAATNRPDVLDPALLRPGRFDRQVVVDLPDARGREEIFKIHTRNLPLSKNVDLKKLAKATPGFSGADIANVCNEAALLAARGDRQKVTDNDFEEARDRAIMGPARKSRILPDEVKKITAYHEAGHTIVNIATNNQSLLHKVTIIPRGRALGVTSYLPQDDIFLYMRSKDELLNDICMAMGGRVAEEIIFQRLDTGASNDIARATDLARKMVTQLGMSEKLGPVAYGEEEGPIFIARDLVTHKNHSEKIAELIDEEIKLIIIGQYNRAKDILTEKKDLLIKLSEALYEKETLDAKEVYELLGMEIPKITLENSE